MKFKLGQIVKLRDGTLTLVVDIEDKHYSRFVVTCKNGFTYTREGRYHHENGNHPKDIVEIIHLHDGQNIKMGDKEYIAYGGQLYFFEKWNSRGPVNPKAEPFKLDFDFFDS